MSHKYMTDPTLVVQDISISLSLSLSLCVCVCVNNVCMYKIEIFLICENTKCILIYAFNTIQFNFNKRYYYFNESVIKQLN